ncbi:hypothetical protein Tco_0359803 [Tanacetum coccineum]
MTTKAQQIAMDNALVAPENQRVIGKCNMRINPGMKPKEPTYQVVLDALALTTCYHAFLITAEVPVIYMHQFWATVNKHNASYRFKIDNKRFSVNVEIKYITDVIVDHLYQPWRTFASIINKCLCGKVSGLDKIRLSRVQILWGMYYKKNLDFVASIWEDLAYQIDNKDSKKQDRMLYPRFTKIIIHHFLKKDKSISIRNRTFMHTARDDSLLGTMRFVSRHEDTQVYGDILLKALTNQAMLDSVSYKTYYAISLGAELLKSKKSQKKSDSAISSEESPSKNKSASKPKPTKKKATVKADKGKSLNVLSEVTLSKATQLKEATKQSKKDFYISHASGLGDGTDFESGVLDEQQRKISGADEETSTKPGVLDIPKYDSESEKESWGDSGEEDDNDEDDNKDESNDDKGSDDDGDNDDNNDDNEEEEYVDEINNEGDNANNATEENEEEEDDDEELYKDINKTDGPMQSSSVTSKFTSKLLNFENASPTENDIASLMDTTVRHEEPSSQTSCLYTVPVTVIPVITYAFTTTITLPPPSFNPLPQQTTSTPTPTTSDATNSFLAFPNISSMFKFNDRVIKVETDLSEMNQESLEAAILAKSYSQPKSNYEAASSLSEFEITKILMDKMEENKSHLRADYKRELYDALVKSYNTEKDLFDTYGDVFKLKRSQDDKDKDQDPSVGSDQRTERRNSSKEAESPKDPRSKEGKSSSSSKGTRSHHKSSGKSAHAEDPSYTVDDSGVQKNQEFDTCNNDEQPDNEAASKND